MQTRTNDNQPGGRDLVGHSGVQAWSAGPLFPAIIKRVERYMHPGDLGDGLPERHLDTSWRLTYPGHEDTTWGSYDEAEAAARYHNARGRKQPAQPAQHVHDVADRIYAETH